MNIYVWQKNFLPDYTDGLGFAIANTYDEAIKILNDEYNSRIYYNQNNPKNPLPTTPDDWLRDLPYDVHPVAVGVCDYIHGGS